MERLIRSTMAKSNRSEGSVALRWRVATMYEPEWKAVSEKKREAFRQSKGRKNPPVRGADFPGYYYLDIYKDGQRDTKRIGLLSTHDSAKNDETERLGK